MLSDHISPAPRPRMPCGLPEPWGPSKHCSVFAVDMAGFGKRDNDDQRAMRHTLYASLESAFACAHVPWNACYYRDSGDGVLIVVPAQFPTLWLASPLIHYLHAALCRHNRLHRESARIQLRAALHAGQVQSDDNGLSGRAVIHLFRLLQSAAPKRALAIYHADLALIVSGYVYQEIIQQEDDPTPYEPVDVHMKETTTRAWLRIFGTAMTRHHALDSGNSRPSAN